MESEYCKLCGKKLPKRILGINFFEKVYEFEDGNYCEKCSKLIINKRRK